jgi:hypothetical protein
MVHLSVMRVSMERFPDCRQLKASQLSLNGVVDGSRVVMADHSAGFRTPSLP